MTSRPVLPALVFALALTGAACSDESSSSGSTTTTSSSTSTTTPATSTSSSTTTSTSSTTSTTSTTTIPVVAGLDLSARGLGEADFGVDAEGAIDYVESILGAPDADTGWIDPASATAVCPGNEIRFVSWADLTLFFSDDSLAATGRRHFASYQYGPAFGAVIDPYGLATDAGIVIGDSVERLLATYPSGVLNAEDRLFFIEDGLFAFLTDAGATGTITEFVGGFGCGE